MNGFTQQPNALRQRDANKFASTNVTNEIVAVLSTFGIGNTPTPQSFARLLLVKVVSAAAGANKFNVDAYLPGDGLSDPTSDSLADADLGGKVLPNALFSASGDLAVDTITAGWLVGYTVDGRASLISLGGGASLPVGEHQYQVYGMVTDNQAGFDFVRAHPIF